MTTAIAIKLVGEVKITPENKCSFCKGATCCTYFTQAIDSPRSMADFDLLLWQISHRNTQLYRDSDGWFLLINNPCQHLQPGGHCGIYATRPQICREHSNDDCEFEGPSGEEDFDLFFRDYDSLLVYCRKKFNSWDVHFRKLSNSKKKKRARR
jgi:Fe-S-cluster containining protein